MENKINRGKMTRSFFKLVVGAAFLFASLISFIWIFNDDLHEREEKINWLSTKAMVEVSKVSKYSSNGSPEIFTIWYSFKHNEKLFDGSYSESLIQDRLYKTGYSVDDYVQELSDIEVVDVLYDPISPINSIRVKNEISALPYFKALPSILILFIGCYFFVKGMTLRSYTKKEMVKYAYKKWVNEVSVDNKAIKAEMKFPIGMSGALTIVFLIPFLALLFAFEEIDGLFVFVSFFLLIVPVAIAYFVFIPSLRKYMKYGQCLFIPEVETFKTGELVGGAIYFGNSDDGGKFLIRLICYEVTYSTRTVKGRERSVRNTYKRWSEEIVPNIKRFDFGTSLTFKIKIPSNSLVSGQSEDGFHEWCVEVESTGMKDINLECKFDIGVNG